MPSLGKGGLHPFPLCKPAGQTWALNSVLRDLSTCTCLGLSMTFESIGPNSAYESGKSPMRFTEEP